MKSLFLISLLNPIVFAAPSVFGTIHKICYSDLAGACLAIHLNGYIDGFDRIFVPSSLTSVIPKINRAALQSAKLRIESWQPRVDTLLASANDRSEVRNAQRDANAALGLGAALAPGCFLSASACMEGGALIPETFGVSVFVVWAKCINAGVCGAKMVEQFIIDLDERSKAGKEKEKEKEKEDHNKPGEGENHGSTTSNPTPHSGPPIIAPPPSEGPDHLRRPIVTICDPSSSCEEELRQTFGG